MKFKDADKYAQTVTAKRFWLFMSNGNTIHLYEGQAFKSYGQWGHKKRFAGWKDLCGRNGKPEKAIRCSTAHKKWKTFWLASELTRTDWKIQILSDEAKLLLCQSLNYAKIYGK